MSRTLRVASYNLHKGLSAFNRRLVVHDVRQAMHALSPDLILLQEVQGAHQGNAQRFSHWPADPQHEYLAGDEFTAIYGRNANYRHGHHGNALLTRFPVRRWDNHDLTLHKLEQRGLLHAVLEVEGWDRPLHALSVHLNLRAPDRRKQLALLAGYIQAEVPMHAPLVLAGDFNDWRREATPILARELGLSEAFETLHGAPARSFPARLPLLTLDRVYVRGLQIETAAVLGGAPWAGLSDHAPLLAELTRNEGA
ncbi:Metal-dependent hydrolase, endonuclease/exonuclease/phosphatase family [Andreprevotia lacus DSM 23236]|jgi:endonuclease/exonuclease/phosphatase family metal-dependent hydrolase|uniref:Metal-dependent hydrolase, endonuclease/exonuclease/phosphatase family n=1 Tax=Andreprevotia lacus DSM 23236 TaxID=1121001 RepID=A0A1W1XDW0_9NEIS|nr:endonuclease/exonuclease/phosphatase family protein [Andreprevotia lacus]SMC22079.1 Metal-dependent hydrolase, endonuclease/exonuclease/phosphatase family [Andreprevotia lacus DSM 23236]